MCAQMGQTPLHLAAYRGQADMVKMLIDAGAKLSAVTNDGLTAADMAAAEGEEAVSIIIHRAIAGAAAAVRPPLTPHPPCISIHCDMRVCVRAQTPSSVPSASTGPPSAASESAGVVPPVPAEARAPAPQEPVIDVKAPKRPANPQAHVKSPSVKAGKGRQLAVKPSPPVGVAVPAPTQPTDAQTDTPQPAPQLDGVKSVGGRPTVKRVVKATSPAKRAAPQPSQRTQPEPASDKGTATATATAVPASESPATQESGDTAYSVVLPTLAYTSAVPPEMPSAVSPRSWRAPVKPDAKPAPFPYKAASHRKSVQGDKPVVTVAILQLDTNPALVPAVAVSEPVVPAPSPTRIPLAPSRHKPTAPQPHRKLVPTRAVLAGVVSPGEGKAGPKEVEELFASLGLRHVAAPFIDAGFDTLERFALLEGEDMAPLKVDMKAGHRKQLLHVAATLKAMVMAV